jgi:hypothetical protein
MNGCNQACDQGRTCDCCAYLTPGESKRFWWTIGIAAVVDIAVIAALLWVWK